MSDTDPHLGPRLPRILHSAATINHHNEDHPRIPLIGLTKTFALTRPGCGMPATVLHEAQPRMPLMAHTKSGALAHLERSANALCSTPLMRANSAPGFISDSRNCVGTQRKLPTPSYSVALEYHDKAPVLLPTISYRDAGLITIFERGERGSSGVVVRGYADGDGDLMNTLGGGWSEQYWKHYC
ncbi:hypothetical protein BDQ17DRAFT_1361220, partial [Cyathus striatus]